MSLGVFFFLEKKSASSPASPTSLFLILLMICVMFWLFVSRQVSRYYRKERFAFFFHYVFLKIKDRLRKKKVGFCIKTLIMYPKV